MGSHVLTYGLILGKKKHPLSADVLPIYEGNLIS